MRVAITGGAGFIGTNLSQRLLRDEHEVVVVDNFITGARSNLDGLPVLLFEGSILDPVLLDQAFEQVDAVVHLAALPSVARSMQDPVASNNANVNGTVQVLEAIRRHRVRHTVLASSSSVYGSNPRLPKHEDLIPMPMSPYAASKLAAEMYALTYAQCFELDVLAFRFFNVFGPYQMANHAYAAVIPAFVDAALNGRVLNVYGDGLQTRDFTYVDSVTNVISAAIAQRITSARPVNLAFGERVSLLELIERLEQVLQRPLDRVFSDSRPGDVRDSQADNRRLVELFPTVAPTSLNEGLAATVEWFSDHAGASAPLGGSERRQ